MTDRLSPTERDISLDHLHQRVAIRLVIESLLMVCGATIAYMLLPLNQRTSTGVVIWLALALVVVGAVFAWQIRAIAANSMPMRRAIYAMFVLVPMIVLVFSANYTMVSADNPNSFSEPLSRFDALYFTLTTLSTIGYGDITPVSDLARAIVMVQMVVDVVVLGVAVRLILATARRTKAAQE